MHSKIPTTTFATQFTDVLKERYAARLEDETGHSTEIDVALISMLEDDHAAFNTTADIVLFDGSTTRGIVNVLVENTRTPRPPTPVDIATIYAQLNALTDITGRDNPPGQLLSVGLKGGTLTRIPVVFDQAMWENIYELVLVDSSSELQ